MVFIYYQVYKDYQSVIRFADQWLEIDPEDLEVMIYKARALRRLDRINEAEIILNSLSKHPKDRIQAIVSRELAYISQDEGDLETAIYHLRHSASFKNSYGNPLYPISLTHLAAVLIDSC